MRQRITENTRTGLVRTFLVISVRMKTTFLEFEQPIAELKRRSTSCASSRTIPRSNLRRDRTAAEEKSGAHEGNLRQAHARGRSRRWRATRSGRTRSITSNGIFTDFEELHGDRAFADDPAIVGGLARFNGDACMVHRPPERARHQGEDLPKLRHAASPRVIARRCA